MPDRPDTNGWPDWSKYVLNELIRLNDNQVAVLNKITQVEILTAEVRRLSTEASVLREQIVILKTQIAQLQIKAGLWGAIGAAIPTLAGVLYILLNR